MNRTPLRLHLLGLALFLAPVLFFMARNLDVYTLDFLWPSLGVSAAVAVALLALSWALTRFTGSKIPAVAYLMLGVFWFLQFWHGELAPVTAHGLLPVDALTRVALVILAVALPLALVAQWPVAQRAILLFLGINLALVAYEQFSAQKSRIAAAPPAAGGLQAPAPVAFEPKAPRDLNIYYVILDGLASPQVLQQQFGIDVGPGIRDLAGKHGFYVVPNAQSSYNVTHLTLASIFYQTYPVDENSPRYGDRSLFFPGLLTHPERVSLFTSLDKLGYRLTHVGNSWANCRAGAKIRCLVDHGAESAWIAELMNNYAIQGYFAGSMLDAAYVQSGLARKPRRSIDDNDSLNAFMQLVRKRPEVVQAKRNFFFIHHMNPHPPARDKQCELLEGGNYTREDAAGYRSSVECAFRRVQEFTEMVARLDPTAIVVLQADHGAAVHYSFDEPFEKLSPAHLRERFSIFNAVKLPNDCKSGLFENMGNVETINLVLGCAGGALPTRQTPRSYAGFYETRPEFGIVRRVLPNGGAAAAPGSQ